MKIPRSLSDRDMELIRIVERFKQISAQQIEALLFDGTSYTPANRTLRRLTEAGYLQRIERRIVGGSRGGSGQYVYGLGANGHRMFSPYRWRPVRTVDFHALAIVDCFLILSEMERSGGITIMGVSLEPDCWLEVEGTHLRPDLYIDFVRGVYRARVWLEVDMATEAQRQVRGKLEAYCRASEEEWSDELMARFPRFPTVVWVAVDDDRAIELSWLISQLPDRMQPLFEVATRETLPRLIEQMTSQ